jgi:hypothetical protein
MLAEKLLRCAVVLGAITLCECTAWFDGSFTLGAGALPNLAAEAGAEDLAGGEVQADGGGPTDASIGSAADSTVEGSVPNDAAADGPLSDAVNFDAVDEEAGRTDVAPDAQACTGSLSNIGTADFRVSFTVTGTTQGGLVALVNQRGTCGPGVFWDVRMSGGFVRVEVDDVVNYTNFTTTGVMVNDGRPHDVLIQRSAEVVVAFVDGVESAPFGAKASFGQLAALTVRVDVCASNDMTAALFGTLSNLCVTSP